MAFQPFLMWMIPMLAFSRRRLSCAKPRAKLAVALLSGLALLSTAATGRPQEAAGMVPAGLSTGEIVHRMLLHDQMQRQDLQQYRTMRHYTVQYQGFPRSLSATMDVELTYDTASGKSFRIISQSGSHLLCERVLKRAVDSEAEASHTKDAASLTPENYRFQLAGTDTVNGHAAYVLQVDPIRPGKFLYKGKIWIDSKDFALEKIEAEPAKNPSFWISQTLIHQTYAPANGFWLPLRNRSETKVRFGGTAVFAIDYGPYVDVTGQQPAPVLATGHNLSGADDSQH